MNSLKPILIVEDSLRDTELALDAFDAYRLLNEVIALRDGVEALDFLYRRGPFAGRPEDLPALVLLDLKMPKVDGLEVLRQMKGDPALQRIPVIIMTASREEQDATASQRLGVAAYMVKPVNFHEFIEAVKPLGGAWELVHEPAQAGRSRHTTPLPD